MTKLLAEERILWSLRAGAWTVAPSVVDSGTDSRRRRCSVAELSVMPKQDGVQPPASEQKISQG